MTDKSIEVDAEIRIKLRLKLVDITRNLGEIEEQHLILSQMCIRDSDSIVLILVGCRIPNGDWSTRGRIQVDAVEMCIRDSNQAA